MYIPFWYWWVEEGSETFFVDRFDIKSWNSTRNPYFYFTCFENESTPYSRFNSMCTYRQTAGSFIMIAFLRRCETAITWRRSLSVILPLFWRHDIDELHRLCRENIRNVRWRHEICDVFPRIMTCALQNMQFSQYFTTKFNIFSLKLTRESDFFILFISTYNKLSISGFK